MNARKTKNANCEKISNQENNVIKADIAMKAKNKKKAN